MLKVKVVDGHRFHSGKVGFLDALCGPDRNIARIIVEQNGRSDTVICVDVADIRGV